MTYRLRLSVTLALALAAALYASGNARAERIMRAPVGNAGPGNINLPYVTPDNAGNQWMLYQGGWLRQQGNQPLYSQAATLMINGNGIQQNQNRARIDEKTGEVILENMMAANFEITRRVLFDKEGGFVRYVDIIRNTGAQDQPCNVQIQTNLNYGINNAQYIADPKKKDQNRAWVAQTGAGPSVVEVFSGKNTKNPLAITWQQGNSVVQAGLQVTVPAGKSIAFMHLHTTNPTQDGGSKFVNDLNENKLLKSVPSDVRKLIVNFVVSQSFIGQMEILRGDLLDVVELRSGDQVKGTLNEPVFSLDTFYGPVELPMDRVIAVVNVGQFKPRQLVVTADGQVFGGKLKEETLDLQLSSGQVTQIPLMQVARAGFRKRIGEPEEWTFEKPIVQLRGGERVGVQMPTKPVAVVTRYGTLQLAPEAVGAIVFKSEEHGVHEIHLRDGSKFAGLVSGTEFDMLLDAPGTAQAVKFPVNTISKLQFSPKIAEADDSTPTLKLANDDLLIGTLTGKLAIDTTFDTIEVNAAEVKGLTTPQDAENPTAGTDVQVTLWDGSTLGGQLKQQDLSVKLGSGVEMKVPVSLVVEYEQPQPQPSDQMIDKIKAIIAELNAADWKQRDRAQAQLLSIGPVARSVLKELRENQPAEAQQRIDAILKDLDKPSPNKPATPGAPGVMLPQFMEQQFLVPQFGGDFEVFQCRQQVVVPDGGILNFGNGQVILAGQLEQD